MFAYQIECLKKQGLTDIVLIIGHLGDVIKEYFEDGSKYGVSIEYIHETTPLGTAGGLWYLKEKTLTPPMSATTIGVSAKTDKITDRFAR